MDKFKVIIVEDVKLELKGTEEIFRHDIPEAEIIGTAQNESEFWKLMRGEAPDLVSRYDTITGKVIPVKERVGLLGRKLRVVAENTTTVEEWFDAAKQAYKATYGYEWQGDNLVIARESALYTFFDYYQDKFQGQPTKEQAREIAEIISWNFWQMDGLKGVIPNSCHEDVHVEETLFGDGEEVRIPCKGCQDDDIRRHNGIYCKIMDWETGKPVKFIDLIKP